MMNTTQTVPAGFEAAHEQWILLGGEEFRAKFRCGGGPQYYRSEYWKLVKETTLKLRGFKCCRCGGKANQVHHLNYNFIGEDHYHPESLVAICRSCHSLVEYARNAESIISLIKSRISRCKGFLEDSHDSRYNIAAPLYARLLEYRAKLTKLRSLFAAKTPYENRPIKSDEEREAHLQRYKLELEAYRAQAEKLVSTWNENEKERAKRIVALFEQEIDSCHQFVSEVFAPDSAKNLQQTDMTL
jgi:hypothetical protein